MWLHGLVGDLIQEFIHRLLCEWLRMSINHCHVTFPILQYLFHIFHRIFKLLIPQLWYASSLPQLWHCIYAVSYYSECIDEFGLLHSINSSCCLSIWISSLIIPCLPTVAVIHHIRFFVLQVSRISVKMYHYRIFTIVCVKSTLSRPCIVLVVYVVWILLENYTGKFKSHHIPSIPWRWHFRSSISPHLLHLIPSYHISSITQSAEYATTN